MATKRKRSTISQAEARRLRAENEKMRRERNQQRNAWVRDYPGGTNIGHMTFNAATDFMPAVVHNSRQLGHAVVVTVDGTRLQFYALPLPNL